MYTSTEDIKRLEDTLKLKKEYLAKVKIALTFHSKTETSNLICKHISEPIDEVLAMDLDSDTRDMKIDKIKEDGKKEIFKKMKSEVKKKRRELKIKDIKKEIKGLSERIEYLKQEAKFDVAVVEIKIEKPEKKATERFGFEL